MHQRGILCVQTDVPRTCRPHTSPLNISTHIPQNRVDRHRSPQRDVHVKTKFRIQSAGQFHGLRSCLNPGIPHRLQTDIAGTGRLYICCIAVCLHIPVQLVHRSQPIHLIQCTQGIQSNRNSSRLSRKFGVVLRTQRNSPVTCSDSTAFDRNSDASGYTING